MLIGGAATSQEYATEIGAEGYAIDCVSAIDEADRLANGGRPDGEPPPVED